METLLTTSNVTFALGVLAIIFTVYNYFKNPQIENEKKDLILAQQAQWQIESNERRFNGLQDSIKDAFLLAQNHTHTVDVKVDSLVTTVGEMGKQIVQLATIIDERIPKK